MRSIQFQANFIYVTVPFDEKSKLVTYAPGGVWSEKAYAWRYNATLSVFLNLLAFDKPLIKAAIDKNERFREWALHASHVALRIEDLQHNVGELPDFGAYEFASPPYDHQRRAMAFALNVPRSNLWLDLGLGKTYTAINVARYRWQQGQVFKVLVLAPVSILRQWAREVKKYAPEATASVVCGPSRLKANIIRNAPNGGGLHFTLMSYESAVGLKAPIIETQYDMLIMDESTKIKNPKAQRSTSAIQIASSIPYAMALSGLPYLNNPIDLYSQFRAIDSTVYGENLYRFEKKYVEKVRRKNFSIITGARNIDDLKLRAYRATISRTKKDCLDLPDKIYVTQDIPLTSDQLGAYVDIINAFLDNDVDEPTGDKAAAVTTYSLKEKTLANILGVISKLVQITSGWMSTEDGVRWLGSHKYQALLDLLEEYPEKFIIWVHHKYTSDKLLQTLMAQDIPVAALNNTLSSTRREQVIHDFRYTDKVRCLVASLDSEHKGLDLTASTPVNAIFFENTASLDMRWQAESRQHRINMVGSATYVDLIAEGTIDESLKALLDSKLNVAEYIVKHGAEAMLAPNIKRKGLKIHGR